MHVEFDMLDMGTTEWLAPVAQSGPARFGSRPNVPWIWRPALECEPMVTSVKSSTHGDLKKGIVII